MTEFQIESGFQHIKDFNIAIEFKDLMKHAPGGVYLIPEFDNIRKHHGAIFLRRGLYRDGVFRFILELPPDYNNLNTHPIITFTPPFFHPLIDPRTGQLDLTLEIPEWRPTDHFICTALIFLKKIFYLTTFDTYLRIPNDDANRLLLENPDRYRECVQHAVEDSKGRIYDDPQDPNCLLRFTESKPAHDHLLQSLLESTEQPPSHPPHPTPHLRSDSWTHSKTVQMTNEGKGQDEEGEGFTVGGGGMEGLLREGQGFTPTKSKPPSSR